MRVYGEQQQILFNIDVKLYQMAKYFVAFYEQPHQKLLETSALPENILSSIEGPIQAFSIYLK